MANTPRLCWQSKHCASQVASCVIEYQFIVSTGWICAN